MLENNRLYRRIQVNNLFRTFSRTYARQTAKAYPHQAPPLLDHTNQSSRFKRTNIRSCLQQRRNDSLPAYSERNTDQNYSTPSYLKTEQYHHSSERNAFTQTINSSLLEPKHQAYSSNGYLNSLIGKRMDSDSSQVSLQQKKIENFKLKSCALKERERYEGEQEVGDFSLLELEGQQILKNRSSKCHFRNNMGGVVLVRLRGDRESRKNSCTWGATRLVQRYSGTADPGTKAKIEC